MCKEASTVPQQCANGSVVETGLKFAFESSELAGMTKLNACESDLGVKAAFAMLSIC